MCVPLVAITDLSILCKEKTLHIAAERDRTGKKLVARADPSIREKQIISRFFICLCNTRDTN